MLDFYDSNRANRAINTYFDLVNTKDMEPKELVVITLAAYTERVTKHLAKKILGVACDTQLANLVKRGYLVEKREQGFGAEKEYYFNYTPINAEVYPDNVMYVFSNALFNIGKYFRDYKITSWTLLAAIVEIATKVAKNGRIKYDHDSIDCVRGGKPNRIYNRKRLIEMGVIKLYGEQADHQYRVNQKAYLLGAN